jgi:hypothetical protein
LEQNAELSEAAVDRKRFESRVTPTLEPLASGEYRAVFPFRDAESGVFSLISGKKRKNFAKKWDEKRKTFASRAPIR